MKFIHTADLHLGYGYSSSFSPELNERLKNDRKKVLSNIIDLSLKKNVDAIFIAGDLFDTPNPASELYEFVRAEFERTDKRIFIACGNHDPLTADSVYNLPFPENVIIFPENTKRYETDEFDIYGFSFAGPHMLDNSFAGFKAEDENKLNVMVLHGEVVNESFYNPVSVSDIEKSGLDYLALGHIHISEGIKKAGKTYFGYSGTPQGATFKESHTSTVIYGELTKDRLYTEETEVAEHFFKNIIVDISDALSDDETVKIIKSHLSLYNIADTLFSVTLKGYINKSYTPQLKYIKEKLDGVLYLSLSSEVQIRYDIEALKEEKTIRGEFVRNALIMLEGKDEEYIKKVIEYGVSRL